MVCLGFSVSVLQVSWKSDDLSSQESQMSVQNLLMMSLPVLLRHSNFFLAQWFSWVLVCTRFRENRTWKSVLDNKYSLNNISLTHTTKAIYYLEYIIQINHYTCIFFKHCSKFSKLSVALRFDWKSTQFLSVYCDDSKMAQKPKWLHEIEFFLIVYHH